MKAHALEVILKETANRDRIGAKQGVDSRDILKSTKIPLLAGNQILPSLTDTLKPSVSPASAEGFFVSEQLSKSLNSIPSQRTTLVKNVMMILPTFL